MRVYVRLRMILGFWMTVVCIGVLTGCNQQLTNWVGNAKVKPTLPSPVPLQPTTPVATAVPGYAFSAAGQSSSTASYKLHFRVGKAEASGTMTGTNFNLRTGLTSQLKDL